MTNQRGAALRDRHYSQPLPPGVCTTRCMQRKDTCLHTPQRWTTKLSSTTQRCCRVMQQAGERAMCDLAKVCVQADTQGKGHHAWSLMSRCRSAASAHTAAAAGTAAAHLKAGCGNNGAHTSNSPTLLYTEMLAQPQELRRWCACQHTHCCKQQAT